MKTLFFALTMLVITPAVVRAEIFIGLDLADAQSGTELNLNLGTSSTLEIWMSGAVDQNIRALSINLNSDNVGIVNSSNLLFDELTTRWPLNNATADWTGQSATGLLIDNAQGATLGSFAGTGVTFTAASPAVRLGTIDISADTVGSTNLAFSPGSNGVNDATGGITGFAVGGRSLNVLDVTAIPEPSSFAALGTLAMAGLVTRRRRR
ncbi:PEP-CTERM sorting domain-containing protein [Roseiconus lacunae]|uniref:PEP-CTERM sorting domain-containing protein n=1 Tax=Roseiconus lacunae TaxID=2605694 RepID=UPI001E4009F4|nr:PEP-CTERM sorting domain-containing protein [Roseiconus lacunae]MCD0460823.1 PEP-CTERM sorting domain-containing protein [Roseiconus lacunae]